MAQTQGQFGGVSQTPFHTHNGIDSPKIKNTDLIGTGPVILSGKVRMDGAVSPTAVITDDRITSDSAIVVTTTNYVAGMEFSAACSDGFATIYTSIAFDTSFWNYIISI